MAVLFLILVYATGGRLQRWFMAKPSRLAIVTAAAFLIAGAFTFLYWDVRLLARREIIPWYPVAPGRADPVRTESPGRESAGRPDQGLRVAPRSQRDAWRGQPRHLLHGGVGAVVARRFAGWVGQKRGDSSGQRPKQIVRPGRTASAL
jgi:hypothetical protein